MRKEILSDKKLEKARQLEEAIKRIRDDGEEIGRVFKEIGISYKPKSYYALRKRYEERGLEGLMSQKNKCGRKPIDTADEVCTLIKKLKEKDIHIKAKDICEKINKDLGKRLSICQINKIIQKLEISRVKPGRPIQEKVISLNCAGAIIFISAVLETGYINYLIAKEKEFICTVLESIERSYTEGACYEEQGIFSKDKKGKFKNYQLEEAEEYKKNGDISRKFISLEERKKSRNLKRLSICRSDDKTLYRKNMTLLTLPIFTKHSRFRELNETQGNELEFISGYDYKSNTIDRFTREMKYLQLSYTLLLLTADFCINYLWKEKKGEKITLICYYFDGYMKPLWSSYRVKQSRIARVGRVMGCLEEVFVHSGLGYPVILQTVAGGIYLPEAIRRLHTDMKKIMPHVGSQISIFDGGGNSVDFFETFKGEDYFICILDNNQYKQELSDFEIIESNEMEGELFIDAKKKLQNSKTGEIYSTRTPIYKKKGRDKYIAFVTNIPSEELTAQEVIEIYYRRWRCQESRFREMNMGISLATNYGYGKTRVINLVVLEKKKKLNIQIEKKKERINLFFHKIDELKINIEKVTREIKIYKKEYDEKRKEIERDIKSCNDSRELSKLLKKLKSLNSENEKKKVIRTKTEWKNKRTIDNLQVKKKHQEKLLKKEQSELERISKKELVYKNDVELDQLMGMYKIAFVNLCAFVLREYFLDLNISLENLIDKVFKRPGKMIIRGKAKIVQIYLNEKDKKLSEHIRKACEVINSKGIKQTNSVKLTIEGFYQKSSDSLSGNLDYLF